MLFCFLNNSYEENDYGLLIKQLVIGFFVSLKNLILIEYHNYEYYFTANTL